MEDMNEDQIRKDVNAKLLSMKTVAKEVGINYPYLTKFLKGSHLGDEALLKVKEWLATKY